MDMVKSTVVAANSELELLNNQLVAAQGDQFTRDTNVKKAMERFPTVGKETEEEIKTHQWMKDV